MGHFLPDAVMANVEHLTLRCQYEVKGSPSWPDSWTSFEYLTSLDLSCMAESSYYLPDGFVSLEFAPLLELQELTLTCNFNEFLDRFPTVALLVRLKFVALEVLRVNVVLLNPDSLRWDLAMQCVFESCERLCMRNPGSRYTHSITDLKHGGCVRQHGEVRLLSFLFGDSPLPFPLRYVES